MKEINEGQVLWIDRKNPRGKFVTFELVMEMVPKLPIIMCYSGLIITVVNKEKGEDEWTFDMFQLIKYEYEPDSFVPVSPPLFSEWAIN